MGDGVADRAGVGEGFRCLGRKIGIQVQAMYALHVRRVMGVKHLRPHFQRERAIELIDQLRIS